MVSSQNMSSLRKLVLHVLNSKNHVIFWTSIMLLGTIVSFLMGTLTSYSSKLPSPLPVGIGKTDSTLEDHGVVDGRRSGNVVRELMEGATEEDKFRVREDSARKVSTKDEKQSVTEYVPTKDIMAISTLPNQNEIGNNTIQGASIQDRESESPPHASGYRFTVDKMRRVLRRSIKNVEDEILKFNVGDLLKEISNESLPRESRLLRKLRRALTSSDEECVIRIVKYCAQRCEHFLGKSFAQSFMQWHSFACPSVSSRCSVETRFASEMSASLMEETDILILVASLHRGLQLDTLMARRPPGQLWMLNSRESPQHDPEYAPRLGTENPYNLTMTFFHDSDMLFPYCYTEPRIGRAPEPQNNKTKLVTWMASNCHLLSWTRGELVKKIQEQLPIDTYGKCGDLGRLDDALVDKTLSQYKFYLAFENSECRDYITEKAWRTGLERGLVPIVYGSRREDYERTLPRNSFIFLQDFATMREFADYVRALDADDALYRKYSNWRTDTQVYCTSARFFTMVSPEVNMCYLLRKFIHIHAHPETSWRRSVPDFKTWWNGKCSDVSLKQEVLGFDVHEHIPKKTLYVDKRIKRGK